MARPRTFDEDAALDAAGAAFWRRGFDGTSLRDLMAATGLSGASLYNAFGDKRALYERTLERYVERSIVARIDRCRQLPPRAGIAAFFADIVERSLADPHHRGCMLVNAALEVAPHDGGFHDEVAGALGRIEAYFHAAVAAGQAAGSIGRRLPATELAAHLLATLIGLRVLARLRPDAAVLNGVVAPALALLEPGAHEPGAGV